MKTIDLQELHEILYEMANTFHEICLKHGITYYMLGGTMLGAVRHQEIIPWDDDMDFGVTRERFAELKVILAKELPPHYKVIDLINMENHASPTIKIEDTRTHITEIGRDVEQGVFIDVFPLDKTNGNKGFFSRNALVQNLVRIDQYRDKKLQRDSSAKKLIGHVARPLFFAFPHNYFLKKAERLASRGKGSYCANHFGFWRMKEIVPMNIFEGRKLYKIGPIELYGVGDYDRYLKSLYGDYMQLPPEDKRHIHITEMYWK